MEQRGRASGSARREEARLRGDIYRLLSKIYLAPPEPDLVRRMTDADFLEDLSALLGGRAVAELEDLAAGPDRDPGVLHQEYMDLFAVPTGRYVAPFEDVYQGAAESEVPAGGRLLGERAVAARRIYREGGAGMDPACKELPTHIGVELSFMSFLCDKEAAEPGGTRELQLRFLTEHLNDWFPRLGRTIRERTDSRFYRGVVPLTGEFLSREAAGLRESTRPGRRPCRDTSEPAGEG